MAPPPSGLATSEAVLSVSRRALAALHEELDAARKALEASQAARAGFLGAEAVGDLLQAVQATAETAAGAAVALKRAHGDLMDLHYASLRGEAPTIGGAEAPMPLPAPSQRGPEGGDADGTAANNHDGPMAVAEEALTDAAREELLEARRAEIHAKRWALPEDTEAAQRAAAAAAGVATSGPTAAAAAFAAAEEAAKRRLAERSGDATGGADDGVWYSWRTDIDLHRDDDETRKDELTRPLMKEQAVDFTMFHRDAWERAQKRAEAMMMEQQPGIFVYRESLPRPQIKVPGCLQVKVRVVQTNTEEKIVRCYQAMAAGGGADRHGFLLGANLGRFITLAKDRSDFEAKSGGDLGWITKGKIDPRIEEVVYATAKGACSPPFRVKLASFNIVFCEDRR